jgi:2-keto-4-pentenoate hydratase
MTAQSSAAHLTQCADSLYTAESARRPVAPLTDSYPNLELREAYRIQQINVERRTSAGERIVGHKIGLTARAMQEKFGVREPDYGHLLDTMFHDAGTALDLSSLIDPQIEVEPAFVLKKRLMGPAVDAAEVIAATDFVCICFEVIDSRIIDWRIKLQDTVADNGSSARVILGAKRFKAENVPLDDLATFLELDGAVVETGNSSAILGHPAYGVAWLANRLAEFGIALEPGHIVLPGTCTRSRRIAGCWRVGGRMQGIGELSIRLEGAPAIKSSEN